MKHDPQLLNLAKNARVACLIVLMSCVAACIWPRTWPLIVAGLANYAGAVVSVLVHVARSSQPTHDPTE